MHVLLLIDFPAPSTLVEGPIDLGKLSTPQARAMRGQRRRFIVWRQSLFDECGGRLYFDAWHNCGVHCLVRMAR